MLDVSKISSIKKMSKERIILVHTMKKPKQMNPWIRDWPLFSGTCKVKLDSCWIFVNGHFLCKFMLNPGAHLTSDSNELC